MGRRPSLVGALLALICLTATAASSTSPTWVWRNPLPSPDTFTVIASGGGTYVTAGQDGVIYHSTDGIHWIQVKDSPLGTGSQYLDALYANGNFLLAGVDATGDPHVSTSSDGVTWADSKLDLDPNFGSFGGFPILQLGFGNGTYVVLGAKGEATSTDAATWKTHGLSFIDNSISNPLLFANGVFIKDGIKNSDGASTIFFSSNGVSWTESPVAQSGILATDGATFFMFLQDGSAVYTSTDGDNWSKNVPTGGVPAGENEVLWDGTQFLTIGLQGLLGISYSSPDGLAWTHLSSTEPPFKFDTGLHSMTAMGATYTSVASGALHVMQSTDFYHWSAVFSGSSGPNFDLADVIDGGGHFVAVGRTSKNLPTIMESTDGTTWKTALSSGTPADLTTVAYGKGLYVAAGSSDWFSSSDAVTWTPIAAPPVTAVQGDLVYGNGTFVALVDPCNNGSCATATSPDGKTWTSNTRSPAKTLAYDGTRFVSVADDSSETGEAAVYTSCDGTTWSHSADISVRKGDTFSRIRPISTGLVAMGSQICLADDPADCDPDQGAVIATTEDSSHWTAHELGNFSGVEFTDVAFVGNNYYAVVNSTDPTELFGILYTSTDAVNWTALSGTPVATPFNSLATDGSHLIVAGNDGDIISAAVSGGSSTPTGGVCSALPSVDGSSSSGSFDLLTLSGLLGLLMFRRRAGI